MLSPTEEASDSGDMTVPYTFTFRDVILYALGSMCTCVYMNIDVLVYRSIYIYSILTVGAEVSQTNTSELKFLFEGHEDFSTIPSYAVLPAMVCTCTRREIV